MKRFTDFLMLLEDGYDFKYPFSRKDMDFIAKGKILVPALEKLNDIVRNNFPFKYDHEGERYSLSEEGHAYLRYVNAALQRDVKTGTPHFASEHESLKQRYPNSGLVDNRISHDNTGRQNLIEHMGRLTGQIHDWHPSVRSEVAPFIKKFALDDEYEHQLFDKGYIKGKEYSEKMPKHEKENFYYQNTPVFEEENPDGTKSKVIFNHVIHEFDGKHFDPFEDENMNEAVNPETYKEALVLFKKMGPTEKLRCTSEGYLVRLKQNGVKPELLPHLKHLALAFEQDLPDESYSRSS